MANGPFPLPSSSLCFPLPSERIPTHVACHRCERTSPPRRRYTHAPRLAGFTAVSRRYNNLYALAVHEIQSAGPTKELRFGNYLRHSNARMHGIMHRRLLSAQDSTAV
eukprot:7499313-Pyramimonas_sp.AAC.1